MAGAGLAAASLSRRAAAGCGRGAGLRATLKAEALADVEKKYASDVKAIRRSCADILGEAEDDLFLLRFAMEHKGDVAAAVANLKEVMKWRKGEGKAIVTAAAQALAQATEGGGWNNEPVTAGAPHYAKIGKFITGNQILVLPLSSGDLVSVIRAGVIDSAKLMDAVTVEEMTDFFIYAREVNWTVAQTRTKATGKIVKLLAVNDVSGISSFPDSRFQKALTGSSKKATELYPAIAGPTVILNLPGIVRLLVTFFKPLFPGSVQEKIKFATGPVNFNELLDLTKEPFKSNFLSDMEKILAA